MKHPVLRSVLMAAGALLWLGWAGEGRPAGDGRVRDLAPEVRRHLDEAAALGLIRERDPVVLSPGLVRRMATAPDLPVKVWVHLRDKGVGTRASLAEGLGAVGEGLPDRARRRRESLGADLGIDFRDLPVHEGYVARLRDAGFRVRRVSRWLNAVSLEVPARRLPEVAALGFVRSVRPILVRPAGADPGIERNRYEMPPALSPQCGGIVLADSLELAFYGTSFSQLNQIQALDLHRLGYTGAGVRVMVLDTGFRKDHPAFGCSNLVAEWDFVNEDGNTQNEPGDPPSSQGHGTGTWGVLGGYAPGSLIGPAFASEIVLAKTEDVSQEVRAEEDNYVAALEWGDTLGVDVTSASLAYLAFDDSTGYTFEDLDGNTAAITVAIDIAAAKGILCVNAMGNSGSLGASSLWTPADADSMLAVGAVDSCDVVAGFSSRGPTFDGRIKPEICARGVQTTWAQAGTGGYGPASGTSLSTPLIGGLAALIKEAHPGWTGVDIREAVTGTGSVAGSPDNMIGWGVARGLDALTFDGATAEPPRTTLPFRLLEPADGAVLETVTPTLTWSPSFAAAGSGVSYRVLMDADPAFADPETVYTGPDTSYTFALGVTPGATRWWRVEATGDLGFVRKSMNVHAFSVDVALDAGPPPAALRPAFLAPAFPNPMAARTTIAFRVPEGTDATLEIVSVRGRLVRRFAVAGTGADQNVVWDGVDDAGQESPAGVYFVRLVAGDERMSRRLVRLR